MTRPARTRSPRSDDRLHVVPTPVPAPPGVYLVTIVEAHEDAIVVLDRGARAVARRDPSVHPVVLEGAARRGERVLVERTAEGALVVVGALRTQPTPGIDRADEYEIAADRIRLAAGRELSLTAKTAAVVLRAAGEVETYADRILSRAEGVHKIIGRMLRLN